MAIERLFHWKCDYCKKETQKHDYGMPTGWVFIKKMGGPVPHACDECRKTLPVTTKIGE